MHIYMPNKNTSVQEQVKYISTIGMVIYCMYHVFKWTTGTSDKHTTTNYNKNIHIN